MSIAKRSSLDASIQPNLRRLDAMTVAQRLETIRASMGLTQSEFAAQSGVPLRTYNSYATGKRRPSSELLEWIALQGYSLNWLLTGLGAMRPEEVAPTCGPEGPLVQVYAAFDAELNARVVEAVSTVYKECGGRISPRDLGRVSAEIYNDIAQAGLSSWDEKMGALGLAAAQLRRRLLAPPEPASTQGKHSA